MNIHVWARVHHPIALTIVVAVLLGVIGLSSFATNAVFASQVGAGSNSLGAMKLDPPAGQSAPTPGVSGVVNLSWSATPTDPGTHTLTYLVLRRVSGVDPYVEVASTASTTYADTPPADGLYDYKIQAKVLGGGGGYFTSGDSAVQTGRSDRTAPVATAVSPSASDVTQLTISVTYSDGGTGVTSVALWAKAVGAPSFSLVSTQSFSASASGTRTFSYTASAGVGSYQFYSIATDAAGNVEAVPGAAELWTLFDPTLEFKRTTNNNSPDLDMNPNYAPSGADTTCTLGASGCTWTAPAYSAGQGFSGPSSTATLYLENTAGVPPTLRSVTATYTGNATSTYCGYSSPYWAGDVVICAISYGGSGGATFGAPGGPWVKIKHTESTWVGIIWYYAVLTTGCNGACSGGGAYPVDLGSKRRFTSVSLLYTGVDTTSPIVANDGLPDGACCFTTHDAPSINTGTVTNTMIVTAYAVQAVATWTPPSGAYGTMIEERELQAPTSGSGNQVGSEINDLVQSAAGATGTRTANSSVVGTGVSHILALRPLPATCIVTVALLKNGVSFASNTGSITTGSVVSTPVAIGHGAVSFAAGDKLSVKVTQPVSASCAVKVHYDGTGAVSKLVHPQ